jgi:hypothetical protein
MSGDHNQYQKPTGKDNLQVEAMKQEPVGEIVKAFSDLYAVHIPVMPPVGTKLYTAPTQREWVGLTDAEALDVWGKVKLGQTEDQGALLLYKAFEAKLKAKNAYGWQSVSNPTEYLDDLRGGKDT